MIGFGTRNSGKPMPHVFAQKTHMCPPLYVIPNWLVHLYVLQCCFFKTPHMFFFVCDDSTTLSETMDIILPGLRYASGDHSGGCYVPHFLCQERSPPTLTVLRPEVFRKPGRSQGLLYRYLCH